MNDNTRRQWERFCDEHPEMDAHECLALYWMVHMHSAAEGFTRPGVRLLGAKTHLSKDGVTAVLRRLAERGAIVLKEPAAGRLAALWTIPWLINLAPRIQGAKQGAKQGTSSTPTEYYTRGPASRRGPAATHPALQPRLRPEIVADNAAIAAMGLGP